MALTRFQEAAVDRIVKALENPNGPGRFLLADEVGLGKTLVARGVIEELHQRKSGKALTVVYICSNTEIVEQNKKKLVTPFEFSTERLTLLPVYSGRIEEERKRGKQALLFSFTPGTSLMVGRGSGAKRERQLLLYLLLQSGVAYRNTRNWREFFKGGCKYWDEDFSSPNLDRCFNRPEAGKEIQDKYIGKFFNRIKSINVKNLEEDGCEAPLLDNLDRWVSGCEPNQKNLVIGKLRECLATVCLEFINPDLIIMDEFQRFTDTMENFSKENTLESELIKKRAKILILSATPYKLFNTREEEGSHYSEFYKTLRFLFCEGESHGPRTGRLREHLEKFRELIESGEVEGEGTKVRDIKDMIEKDLREVMCRTERYWYIEEVNKGVLEIPANGEAMKDLIPRTGELIEYARLQQFLLDNGMGSVAIDYWKSCPSILSFMDGSYQLIKDVKSHKVPDSLLLREEQLKDNHLNNLKFRLLLSKVLDNEVEAPRQYSAGKREAWAHLWIPPIYQYYSDKDDLAAKGRPYKFLIFSHWRFVPRAIAAIVSKQIEMRCPGISSIGSGPLKFAGEKTSLFAFDICFPSLRLACEIQPLALALSNGEQTNSAKLITAARAKLRKMLEDAGIKIGTEAPSDWKVIARLEATGPAADMARSAIEDSSVHDDDSRYYQRHTEMYLRYFDDDSALTVSNEQVEKLLRMALFSPANAVLRSAMAVNIDASDLDAVEAIYRGSVQLCINELRNYFNRPMVQAVIRQTAAGRHYNDKVLDYCRRGHFQEMMDEFCYLTVEVLHKKARQDEIDDPPFESFFDHLADVFETHSGSTSINMADASGNMIEKKSKQSAHFALAFGEKNEYDPDDDDRRRLRGSTIRDAFNSPFWPFVLATTSRGQEGLDFHLYCRDVVHWNLPGNPVDLEQREGRINRYDGLCIRQSIRNDYGLFDLKWESANNMKMPNLWATVFATIEEDQNKLFSPHHFKHGLFPHWIYVTNDDAKNNALVRRHLLFYYGSRDLERYRRLKRDLGFYRLAFGQPRQQDMIEEIQSVMTKKGMKINDSLEHLMINLSPLDSDDIRSDCIKGAKKIAADPSQVAVLSQRVHELCVAKLDVLSCVSNEINDLLNFVSLKTSTSLARNNKMIYALAALLYLLNPYDSIYDRFPAFGFKDDIEVIRKAHSKLDV